MRNITIKKIQLTVLGIVLIFSVFLFIYFPNEQKSMLLNGYNKEIQNISNTVALGTTIALTEQNFEGVQMAIEDAKKNKQLLFISLVQFDTVRANGNISIKKSVINTYPAGYNLNLDIISNDVMIVKRSKITTASLNGEVIVGFSTKEISGTIFNARITAFCGSILVTFCGLLIGFWLDRSISIPIKKLSEATKNVGKGMRSLELSGNPRDQIGQLINSFNDMVQKLSEAEKQIFEKNRQLERRNKDITDSINYAQRIQTALLAPEHLLNKHLGEYFIFFKPKDIVSGDFYWATERNNRFYLAVCDSTGHGVPGAFMSLLNISFLNEAINEEEIIHPNEIFNHVRKRLIENISFDSNETKDGMDGILLCIHKLNNEVTYAAANNSPFIMNGMLRELESDNMPVGVGEKNESFNHRTISFKANNILYLYTDGFADQFGGPKGKKFKYKQLNELLASNSYKSLSEQKIILENAFLEWKGELEQVDDILIIGIKMQHRKL